MIDTRWEQPLFQLKPQFKDPFRRKIFPLVKAPLEKVLLLDRINRMYRAMEKPSDIGEFLKKVIHILNFRIRWEENDLERIPRQGPVIVVMNHPYGGLEGILAASLLQSRRGDIKIMANYLLASLSELADLFILADPFEGPEALSRNVAAFREAIRWLKKGGLLGIFPAGEVSHFCFNQKKVIDPPWNKGLVRILAKTHSPVLPVYFNGYNGPLFQIAGLVHPGLRTALLPRELLNKRKKEIEIRIGNLIPYKNLVPFSSDEDKLAYLRHRTYMLAHRASNLPTDPHSYYFLRKDSRHRPVISPGLSSSLLEEIQNLPPRQTLLLHGEYKLIYAHSTQIPHILHEIGRLRELTFRQAGEGTGKALDLDIYDTFYLHLFLWREESQEIVGAYRLGPTDRLMNHLGRGDMYVKTLFTFHPSFFTHIHPALEMGRSFVRLEYQKSYNALLLLWKGIGQFVACHPRYKILFGPVSINQDYQIKSKKLMVSYLKDRNYLAEIAKWVKPKHPFPHKPDAWMEAAASHLLGDIEELSAWVSELEPDRKGVPILLRQYLRLGGKFLGFNVDPLFSHVLDGLILVDLTQTDRPILDRYMGREEAESFLKFHLPERGGSSEVADLPRRAA